MSDVLSPAKARITVGIKLSEYALVQALLPKENSFETPSKHLWVRLKTDTLRLYSQPRCDYCFATPPRLWWLHGEQSWATVTDPQPLHPCLYAKVWSINVCHRHICSTSCCDLWYADNGSGTELNHFRWGWGIVQRLLFTSATIK